MEIAKYRAVSVGNSKQRALFPSSSILTSFRKPNSTAIVWRPRKTISFHAVALPRRLYSLRHCCPTTSRSSRKMCGAHFLSQLSTRNSQPNCGILLGRYAKWYRRVDNILKNAKAKVLRIQQSASFGSGLLSAAQGVAPLELVASRCSSQAPTSSAHIWPWRWRPRAFM